MKIRNIYKRLNPKKYNLKFTYNKTDNQKRPAWIKIRNLPRNINFISINLGKKVVQNDNG